MKNQTVGLTFAVVVGMVALTGCTAEQLLDAGSQTANTSGATSSPSGPTPTPPASTPTSTPPSAPACEQLARIDWRGEEVGKADEKQVAVGAPFDSGARQGAAGIAHLASDGRVIGYTVAAGDAPSAIQDRFCIDGLSVLHFNGYWVTGDGKDIAPDDYLYLVPDPAVTYLGPDL